MKKMYVILFVCVKVYAQIPFNSSPKFLDKNRVKAQINTVNNKFWAINGSGGAKYEVPKGKGANAQFANSVWIGGLDAGGQLHISCNTYRQSGQDFWSGPLDTANISVYNNTLSSMYNKLWKVDCNDITAFTNAYGNGMISNNTYTVPADIGTYPAKGVGNFKRNLEPFFDNNGNGQYNPAVEGDYPIIKGHQQILSIYNDNQGIHSESQGVPMGIEIHERAYAYSDPNLPDSMQAVNFTTFYHYTIYNRSNLNYTKVYIGDWSDVDLGNYNDDYIGTDTLNNFAYCYNADNNDENVPGITGYGNKPPVVSHAIIKTPCTNDGVDNDHDGFTDENGEQFLMDRTTYYLNNIGAVNPAMTNPAIAVHYYNYMSGKWNDGSFFTNGGNAYGGTTPTKYIYPGNPATNSGWTESSAGNPAGDRRVIFSSGPFDFPANSKIEWGYAVVFSQDTSQAVNTITQFNSRVQRDVRNVKYYDETHQNQQCSSSFNLGLKNNTKNLYASVYPNPANNKVTIILSEKVKIAGLTLTDISGRIIKQTTIQDDSEVSLDIEGLEPGVYFIKIDGERISLTQKLIKN
jgi:hypothetical protein